MLLYLIWFFVGFFFFSKLFAWITCGKCDSQNRINRKTVIITGANGGLGKETTMDLAKRGGRIIMACRNLTTAASVRDEVIRKTGNTQIIVKKLDLSNFDSVREFAKDIVETEERLDILVHIGGIYSGTMKNKLNNSGIEITFATNHLGPFLLTHLLIDSMKKTGTGRIVVISSLAQFAAFTNFNHFDCTTLHTRSPAYLYILSKYANVLFVRELSRRLKNTNITTNSVQPGTVATNIIEDVTIGWKIFFNIFRWHFKTPHEGIQSIIYAAVADETANVTGKFISDCHCFNVSSSKSEMNNALKLWKISENLVQIKSNEETLSEKCL